MILHFKIAGGLLVLLGMVHVGFPRYFGWRKDFAAVSPINREMMYYHTFFFSTHCFADGDKISVLDFQWKTWPARVWATRWTWDWLCFG